MNPEIIKYYNELMKIYAIIVTATMVIPTIVALYFKEYWNEPLKRFFRFFFISFCIHVFMQLFIWTVGNYRPYFLPYMNKWNIRDTNFISILSYLNNFAFLGAFYVSTFKSLQLARIVKIISIALFFIALLNYFYIEDFRAYSFFNASASALFCFIIPLLHLWYVFSTDTTVPIYKNSYFWVGLGMVIPNILGLFLNFTGNKIYATDVVLYFKLSITRYYFVIFSHALIAYAYYLSRFTKYLPAKW
jgi:hypothetical protein